MNLVAIDAASHHRLFQEPAFKEIVIPTKAGKLAQQLTSILNEVFYTWLPQSAISPFSDLPSQKQGQFQTLFEHALKLKSDLLLCENIYYVYDVKPGTVYDEETMSLELIDEMMLQKPDELPRVRFCLAPGLKSQRCPARQLVQAQESDSMEEVLSTCEAPLIHYSMGETVEGTSDSAKSTFIECKALVTLA